MRASWILSLMLAVAVGCDESRPRGSGGSLRRDAAVAVDGGDPFDAGDHDAGAPDATSEDASGAEDATAAVDAAAADAAPGDARAPDAGSRDATAPDAAPRDASAPDAAPLDSGVVDAGPPDAGGPIDATVIIDVDNFCNMTVTPAEITVPAGQTIMVDWFNRSRDYAVDVWLSYGGGYIDLATGTTWDEPIPHCTGPTPHNEYADIGTACSSFRFYFRCQ